MTAFTFPLLVISGPVGVGKTTVGQEISNRLDRQGVPHTFIDLDALTQTYPRPAGDPYGYRLAFANLQAVRANGVAAGSRNLIVSRVVEDRSQYEALQAALPGGVPTICRLMASEAVLLDRVRKRELGAGLGWHERRALELAGRLRQSGPADVVIDTDSRKPADIAEALVAKVTWVDTPA